MALLGVNLGGWLVVERWMTPSLFEGISADNEYELSQHEEGRRRLKNHHKTFLDESDWKWMAKHGIELVRLPVGYWTLHGGDPYIEASEQLDWAFAMAKKYGILILLDLHAAPGAQNDADHSGSGAPHKGDHWLKSRDDQLATIDSLEQFAKKYGHHSQLWGLQLLNEPTPGRWGLRLAWFYRHAYDAVINYLRPGTYVVFSDGYKPWFLTNTFGWLRRRGYPVIMDVHLYYCFDSEAKRKKLDWYFRLAGYSRWLIGLLKWQQPVMIGEWSGALTEIVTREKTEEFLDIQRNAYKHTRAICYWNYKTEHENAWNYRFMIESTPKH
jgi:glucan 1,3-beta-glucosidase